MARPIEILVVLLLLAWLVGAFVVPVGGRMIHQLLVLALGIASFRILLALGLLPRFGAAATPVNEWDENLRLPS